MDDTHHIIYKKHSIDYDLTYYKYCLGRQLLDLGNLNDWLKFRIENGLIPKEECTPEFMLWSVKYINSFCLPAFLEILTEEEIPDSVKIAAVQKDIYGDLLGLLKHPSDAVINAALETAGQAIIHISKPTNKQKLLALSNSIETPDLITKIEKPTIQMQKIHVMGYFDGIKYIKKPCEAVKIAAVKAHGVPVLKNIKHPSENVLLTAIAHTFPVTDIRFFTRYIPHPNQKILCAIKHQINLTKQFIKNLETEKEKNSPEHDENNIDFFCDKCYSINPCATVQIMESHLSEQDKKNALNQLQEKHIIDIFPFPDLLQSKSK